MDYDYPPAPGDIDHPGSYDYDVYYRVVPGLTFEMCQNNAMTPEVVAEFTEAVRWLDQDKGVSGITGDCGFMMWFQGLARATSKKAIFMSSLVHLPAITCAYSKDEKIAIPRDAKIEINQLGLIAETMIDITPKPDSSEDNKSSPLDADCA